MWTSGAAALVGVSIAALGPVLVGMAPAPDYRAELGQRLAGEVHIVAETDSLNAAIELAARIEDEVGALVPVRYEAALARNRAGLIGPAIQAYGRVLELDPNHVGSLYDRAELWLVAGSDADRARAKADLEHTETLRPDHWAVPYRLALLAGQQGDASALEAAVVRAIRAGLDLNLLAQDPAWLPLLRSEQTGPALRRIVVTYGSDALVRDLKERIEGVP